MSVISSSDVYLFHLKRSGRKPKLIKPVYSINYEREQDIEIGLVQGIMPDSKEEYWFARALDYLQINYIFQYSIGMKRVRGWQIIDFLVYTAPLPTPVFIHGEYWHGGVKRAESEYKRKMVDKMLAGHANPTVIIWTAELPNPESAIIAAKTYLKI